MAVTWHRRGLAIGVAVSQRAITVSIPATASGGARVVTIESAGDLRELLDGVADQTRSRLNIAAAVLPGAGHCRTIAFPNLKARELTALAAEYPERFFLLRSNEVSTGAGYGLITCAYDDLLNPIREICHPRYQLRFVPAEMAWLLNAPEGIAVRCADSWHIALRARPNSIVLRRLPGTAAPEELGELLGGAKLTVHREAADVLAAVNATRVKDPAIRNKADAARRRAGAIQYTRVAMLASALAIVLALMLEAANLRLDTQSMVMRRAEVAEEARRAAEHIALLTDLEREFARVAALPRQRLVPADLLLHFGEFLPPGAHLSELTIRGDSAGASIVAEDAVEAIAALRRSELLRPGAAQGSIKRLINPTDGSTSEGITFVLQPASKSASNKRRSNG